MALTFLAGSGDALCVSVVDLPGREPLFVWREGAPVEEPGEFLGWLLPAAGAGRDEGWPAERWLGMVGMPSDCGDSGNLFLQ